jgi:hypothetical protein
MKIKYCQTASGAVLKRSDSATSIRKIEFFYVCAGLRRNSLDSMNSQSVSQSVSMMSQQRFSWFDSRKQSLDSQSLHHSDLDRLQVGLKNGQ